MPRSQDLNSTLKSQAALQNLKIKVTPLRLELVNLFSEQKYSLTQGQVIDKIKHKLGSCDRISVYRNLSVLQSAGLIHKLDNNQYIGCQHRCDKHSHLLVFCSNCKKHSEISNHGILKKIETELKTIGFFSKSSPITIQGLCKNCI